jgi:ferritin-like metal-binding protein YciE
MTLRNLKELVLKELSELYYSEKQLVKMLPQFSAGSLHDELREAFEVHLEQTENQVLRLDQIFKLMGEKPKEARGAAMTGLMKECQEVLQVKKPSPLKDAALISISQKIEHFEIASYGSLSVWVERLNMDEVLDLLQETLEEEEEADEKLFEISERIIEEESDPNLYNNDLEEVGINSNHVRE